jgi:serine/threonine protein kinase
MVAVTNAENKFPIPFGKYLLTDLLAVGGMAEVYRAKIFGASGFEKEMVVKRILPKYAKNPSFVQMLIDEAKIAVNLTHGNIVPIYELGEFEGSYYIAMEYVEGQTVLDVLRTAHTKQGTLAWPYSLAVGAGVAAGLAYAHSRMAPDGSALGLVHRDINPRNIVVTKDGEVKILDFGIARASTKRHQTASGVIKGTPGYMSPEQMYGHAVDFRSDIYCLGILIHELLTLRRLFPAWTVKEMRELYERRPVPRPSTLVASIPPYVDEVIMRALAARPDDRYTDAGVFEEALRTAIAQSGTAVTSMSLARTIAALGTTPPAPQPTSSSTIEAGPGPHVPTTSEKPQAAAPATQPMPHQTSAQPVPGDDQAFVISLATDPRLKQPLAPLAPFPSTRNPPQMGEPPRTQVLAQNHELQWSSAIGDDAELLAIARAASAAPGQTKKILLVLAVVVAVIATPTLAYFAPDILSTIERARAGRVLRDGFMIVKTRPSGAEVILDGKSRGKTNLKLAGIDPDAPHQLLLKVEGQEPIVVEFTPAEFVAGEDGPTFIFERDFATPPGPDAGPGAASENDDKKVDEPKKDETPSSKKKKKAGRKKTR